jgi:prefoldin subunit 5
MKIQSQLALPEEKETVEQAFSRIRRGVGKLKERNTKLQTTVTEMDGRIERLHESLNANATELSNSIETIRQLRESNEARSKRITELENALTAVIRDPKLESPDVKKFSDIIKRATRRN